MQIPNFHIFLSKVIRLFCFPHYCYCPVCALFHGRHCLQMRPFSIFYLFFTPPTYSKTVKRVLATFDFLNKEESSTDEQKSPDE